MRLGVNEICVCVCVRGCDRDLYAVRINVCVCVGGSV